MSELTMARRPAFRFDAIDAFARLQVVLAFVLITGLFVALSWKGANPDMAVEDRESGNPLMQLVNLAVYLPALLFLLNRPGALLATLARGWAYSLLLALTLVSVTWSVVPDVTLRRSLALIVSMVFVLHVVHYFSARQFIRLMAMIFAAMLLASWLALLVPGYGITPRGVHIGRWRGIFEEKNTFGLFCGIACLCFLMMAGLAARASRERTVWLGLLGLSFVALFFSNARTPLLGLLGAGAVMAAVQFLYLPWRWQKRIDRPMRSGLVGTFFFLLLVVLPFSAATLLTLLGRNMTLTGRGKLWEYAIGKGMDRPWLGAGFKAFWTDKVTFDLRVFNRHWSVEGEQQKLTGNAHNGYLDAWLDLGFLGLALVVIMLLSIILRARRGLMRTGDPIYLWHIGAAVFVIIYYFTNSFILQHSVMAWFLVSFAYYSLSADTRLRSSPLRR